MTTYLVLAHQTAASDELLEALRAVARDDPDATFALVVPATPVEHLLVSEEGRAQAVAQRAADEARERWQEAGLRVVRAAIGPPDPLEAVARELGAGRLEYTAIIVSTHPLGVSRWLGLDLPHRLRRQTQLPVTHIVCRLRARRVAPPLPSAETGREETWDLASLASWRGKEVVSADGYRLGKLTEVVYDFVSQEPVWVGVASGVGIRTFLAPARTAFAEGGRLRLACSEAAIREQPHADLGEGFDSLSDERDLYAYFGLPFDERSDVRVLRAGDPLPGLLRVTSE